MMIPKLGAPCAFAAVLPVLLAVGLGLPASAAVRSSTAFDKIEAEVQKLLAAGEDAQALEQLESALRENRGSLQLGNLYRAEIRKRAFEDRAINFMKELAADPAAPREAQFNLAFAYIDKIPRVGPMGSGFLSKRSIAAFKKVLDTDAEDWIANYGIGMNYLHWPEYFKKNESALGYLEKCLELQKTGAPKPYFLLAYLRLGDAHARAGDAEKAVAVWRQGLVLYPAHPDLVARLDLPLERVTQSVNDYYNPNQSMAAIDTDVSVLWATTVPKSAVPIKRPPTRMGAGGQLASGAPLQQSDIGLFSWFTRNLPFLSDRSRHASVDMSILGVTHGSGESKLASDIAHGMILGFISVMNDDGPDRIAAKTREMDGFMRLFYQEGVGMGLAASLDTSDPESVKVFADEIRKLDTGYARLHYVGAGVWFGLEASRDSAAVQRAFEWLGPFGATYAYEGYGFALALFHLKQDVERLAVGQRLAPLAAQAFYHGAGRAFWILGGGDMAALKARVALVPENYRLDAVSGYGLGVGVTRAADPTFVASSLRRPEIADLGLDHFATGVAMAYTIRDVADKEFVAGIVEASAANETRCWLVPLLRWGHEALQAVESAGGDFHSNWRARIREHVSDPNGVVHKGLNCPSAGAR